jgi:parallel beta-helix repeat protein
MSVQKTLRSRHFVMFSHSLIRSLVPRLRAFSCVAVLMIILPHSFELLGAETINISCPAQSLQGAIDRAQLGDTIRVSGVCGENVVVRDDKQRVVIDGGSVASVNGFDVRGKEISIRNFASIRGGSVGIHVHLSSTAVLHNNVIQYAGEGIRIDERSSAIITSNVVNNNGTGIAVNNNSDARIGADGDSKLTGANIVTNNTFGVIIDQSHAVIKGNTISNSLIGIGIWETSRGEIEANTIEGNLMSAILVMNRSEAAISNNSGSSDGVAVHCTYGGRVVGGLYHLTGKVFPKVVELDCVDELSLEEK